MKTRQVKSILIDELLQAGLPDTTSEINGKWYVARPLPFKTMFAWRRRFQVAWRVFTGKSFAFHFKEDE